MAYIRVVALTDLPLQRGMRVVVAGRCLALFRVGADVFALDDACTHATASLAGGWVEDGKVMCPRHAAEFCLKTGKALSPPACDDTRTYPVRIVEGIVEVDVPPDA